MTVYVKCNGDHYLLAIDEDSVEGDDSLHGYADELVRYKIADPVHTPVLIFGVAKDFTGWLELDVMLSPFNQQVIAHAQAAQAQAVYLDASSDEAGRRGHRYTVVFRTSAQVESAFHESALRLGALNPDFACNLCTQLDDTPRVLLWQAPLREARGEPATTPPAGAAAGPVTSNEPIMRLVPRSSGQTLMPAVAEYEVPPPFGTLQADERACRTIRNALLKLLEDVPQVVDVTCSLHGHGVFASVVLRLPAGHTMSSATVDVLKLVDDRVTVFRRKEPLLVEVQAAPELNFPPTAIDKEAPWIEQQAEVMQVVEPYPLVVAAWYAPPTTGAPAMVYIYGDNPFGLALKLHKLHVEQVRSPTEVPREAKCVFNTVTRLIKAQAEGDAIKVEAYRAQLVKPVPDAQAQQAHAARNPNIDPDTGLPFPLTEAQVLTRNRAAAARFAAREAAAPLTGARPPWISQSTPLEGVQRGSAGWTPSISAPTTERYVPCRWCKELIPASIRDDRTPNPNYREHCRTCGALQAATAIPTKSVAMPYLMVFVNPDKTVYLEFVSAPPVPGRLDLSAVDRYTIPARYCQSFDENPMGRK